MAFRVGGVGNRHPQLTFDRPAETTGKRRIIYIEEDLSPFPGGDEEYPLDHRPVKRRRESFTLDVHFYTDDALRHSPNPHHHHPSLPLHRRTPPPPAGLGLERTASGLSISDDPSTSHRSASTELLEDAAAARRVREHMASFHRRNPDSHHERVLRNIISPKGSAYPLDNISLESIFLSANEIFFHGRLSQRVTWDWSHSSSPHYDGSVIGTTALRHVRESKRRGFETLIVLSSPILRDGKYSRRLLISTFLHELIHSYLFICCGFRARHCGGHTPGFRTIARLVDDWAGPESLLYLSEVEADLSCFRAEEHDFDPSGFAAYRVGAKAVGMERSSSGSSQKENRYPCSHVVAEHGYGGSPGPHDDADRRGYDSPDSNPALHQHDAVPIRVEYLKEDYDGRNDRQWQDDRAAHPPSQHVYHHPHGFRYYADEQ